MIKRLLKPVLAIAALAYAMVCGYMAWNQRAFIYRVHPDKPDIRFSSVPRLMEATLASADGAKLNAWIVEPANAAAPVYLYFPGNARNHANRTDRFRALTESGAGLVAIHYRGYGGSDGSPSEAALHEDARVAYEEAKRRFPTNRLIAFGESLGTGVAVKLASEKPVTALILDSPYVSVMDRAWATYPWLPVPLLLVDSFRSDRWIGQVRAPLLVLHGARDRVIPIEDGRRLFALASQPKAFAEFPEAGHVGAFRFGAMEKIRTFLKETAGIPD